MQKVTYFCLLLCALMCMSTRATFAEAQTTTTTITQESRATGTIPSRAIVLATVNIFNAKILSQNNNVFNISFDLNNREIPQPKVRYAIQLMGVNSKGGKYVVDEKVYGEDIDLKENTTVSKAIEYIAPSHVSGDYELYVQSKSPVGMPYATARLGKVTLKAGVSGVVIDTKGCFLSVAGEAGAIKYTLEQGVDIARNEMLTVSCPVENQSAEPVVLTPVYETKYRSQFGDVVNALGGSTATVTLMAKQKKAVVFELPKAQTPQSYKVQLTLTSATHTSNSVSALYVLQGVGSTIQTIAIDKDYYSGTATALVSFVWSGSADGFNGSRLGQPSENASQYLVKVEGTAGQCAIPLTNKLEQMGKVEIAILMTQECRDPKVIVSLLSANSDVLSMQELKRTSPLIVEVVNAAPTSAPTKAFVLWGISIVLGILAGFALVYRRVKNLKIPQTEITV